jgi:hypothetical protein
VRKKNGNGGERLGIIKDVADGTHEAHAAFVRRDIRVTPRKRRAALLQFANPVKRRLRPRTTVAVGLACFPVDDGDELELFVDSWPVMSAGDARFDTGGPGKT